MQNSFYRILDQKFVQYMTINIHKKQIVWRKGLMVVKLFLHNLQNPLNVLELLKRFYFYLIKNGKNSNL